MELYSLAINGTTLYFLGQIDEKLYSKIDSLIKNIDVDAYDNDCENFCKMFTTLVETTLNIDLKHLRIKYVFRK